MAVLPMCVKHGLYVGYPCEFASVCQLRPTWALCGLPIREFALVLLMCVRHRLYVGYSYVGLHWVCPCLSDMGFMWATIRFARVCPTRALCGLPICGFASVFPFETHMGFMRATYMWICVGFVLCWTHMIGFILPVVSRWRRSCIFLSVVMVVMKSSVNLWEILQKKSNLSRRARPSASSMIICPSPFPSKGHSNISGRSSALRFSKIGSWEQI